MRNAKLIILLVFMLSWMSAPSAEASVFSDALTKAKSAMQSAFQMNFLADVPVIFYKKSFDTMFDYTQKSVEDMELEYNGQEVTSDDFQDDKELHIKKSAELALHIKSLTGSKVLAYVGTLAIGAIKELIDGSFLNPNGSRTMEDFEADMVGAAAVFGEEAFDKSLNKHLDSFVEGDITKEVPADTEDTGTEAQAVTITESEDYSDSEIQTESAAMSAVEYTTETTAQSAADKSAERQELLQQYYDAAASGNTAKVQELAAKLQALN